MDNIDVMSFTNFGTSVTSNFAKPAKNDLTLSQKNLFLAFLTLEMLQNLNLN